MRVLIIGAVAAGTSAAAKARRNDESAEIVIYEKDTYISYSGCGMPFYLSGELLDKEELYPRDEKYFKKKYNVDVLTSHEVLEIDPEKKAIKVKNLKSGDEFYDHYDKLVIATGARMSVPGIPGVCRKNVFTFRNINDLNRLEKFIKEENPKKACIIGTGYLGLELCDSLTRIGIKVSLVARKPYVTSALDPDMAVYVEDYIREKGIEVLKGKTVKEIGDKKIEFSDGTALDCDFVVLATGVEPCTELAKKAGIKLGVRGAILVNEKMETSIPDIYACGDCVALNHLVANIPVYKPLGSTANKTGRVAGDNLSGGNSSMPGVLGTGIFRVFDMAVGVTGLTEKEAETLGYDVASCVDIKVDKPEYLGGKEIVIKAVACRRTGRLLGVQIVGQSGVDKRLDVFVAALTFKASVKDLINLDLAYSPPFSTTKDPVMYIGMILDNMINRDKKLVQPRELAGMMEAGEEINIIDTREKAYYNISHIKGAKNIPLKDLRAEADSLDKNKKTACYCNEGQTACNAQNILINKGFSDVYNLTGGIKHYKKVNKGEG